MELKSSSRIIRPRFILLGDDTPIFSLYRKWYYVKIVIFNHNELIVCMKPRKEAGCDTRI